MSTTRMMEYDLLTRSFRMDITFPCSYYTSLVAAILLVEIIPKMILVTSPPVHADGWLWYCYIVICPRGRHLSATECDSYEGEVIPSMWRSTCHTWRNSLGNLVLNLNAVSTRFERYTGRNDRRHARILAVTNIHGCGLVQENA